MIYLHGHQPDGLRPAVRTSRSCGACSRPSPRRRGILHLLDQSLRAEGVQFSSVRNRALFTILDDCGVGVTAPSSLDQKVVGVLGVMSNTAMAYEHVIPMAGYPAKLLGSARA